MVPVMKGFPLFVHFKSGLLSVSMLIVSVGFLRADVISSNVFERAKAVALASANLSVEIGTRRDMAIVALRNAMAVETDASEEFLAAVKSTDRNKQTAARKKLDEISESVKESQDILQQIADYYVESVATVELIRQVERSLTAARTQREAESQLKRIEKLAVAAGKTAAKANASADILKKLWLLPVGKMHALDQPAGER